MTVDELAKALSRYRFQYRSEEDIQRAIESVLTKLEISFEAQVRLDKGSRLDVLTADGVGIEIKVDGSNANVIRQLHRYAGFDRVKSLLLFTTRARHKMGLPETMQGKPVRITVHSFL